MTEVEVRCWSAGISPERVIVVGDKSFGEHNGHVYAKRHRSDYFEQCVAPLDGEWFLTRNRHFREFYGERFLDMMAPVLTEDGMVRVFTPEHRFISADGKHLTAAGAWYYAKRIDWNKFLEYDEKIDVRNSPAMIRNVRRVNGNGRETQERR